MTLQSLPECNGELTAGITFINNVSQLAFEILYSHSHLYCGVSFDSKYLIVCLFTPPLDRYQWRWLTKMGFCGNLHFQFQP